MQQEELALLQNFGECNASWNTYDSALTLLWDWPNMLHPYYNNSNINDNNNVMYTCGTFWFWTYTSDAAARILIKMEKKIIFLFFGLPSLDSFKNPKWILKSHP